MIESDLIGEDDDLPTLAWALAAGAIWLAVGLASVVVAPVLLARRVLECLTTLRQGPPIVPMDEREQDVLDELRRCRALPAPGEPVAAVAIEKYPVPSEPAGSHPPTAEMAGAGLPALDARP